MKNLKNRSSQIYTSAIFSPAFSCLKRTYNKFMESSLINRLFTYMTNETVLLNYSYILDEEEESSSETRLPHSHYKMQKSLLNNVSDRSLTNAQELTC